MEMKQINSDAREKTNDPAKKEPDKLDSSQSIHLIGYLRVAILFLINLLNYMDRLIIAGNLSNSF